MSLVEPEGQDGVGWRRVARRFARRYNRARWLAVTIPAFAAVNLAFGLAAVLFRAARWPGSVLGIAYAVALTLLAAAGWILMRRNRFTPAEAMVRLDAVLRLHNRLSSAAAGVGPWPAERGDVRDGLAWDWRRVGLAPVLSLAVMVLLAAIAPSPVAADRFADPQEPLAWTQMEQWIETLRDTRASDEETLDRWTEQIEALRDRPRAEWYSHAGIEAGDTLKAALDGALRTFSRDLESVAQTLAKIDDAAAARMSAADWEKLAQNLEAAARLLDAGALRLDPELLAKLRQLAECELRSLSAAEIAGLREGICEAWNACAMCLGKEGEDLALMLAGLAPGAGGIDRGPGDAPLTLAEEESRLGTEGVEALPRGDLERAALGDLVRVGSAIPEPAMDAPEGPVAGGGVASAGAGGETVWRNPMTPEERRILERYFR